MQINRFKKNIKWKDRPLILGIFAATILLYVLLKLCEDRSFFVLSADTLLALYIILEIAAIGIAFCVFVVTYYSSSHTQGASVFIIACTFLSVTLLDMVHIFSYKGMPYFLTISLPQKATALWMVSRLVMSIGMFIASLLPSRKRIEGYPGVYIAIDIILTLLTIALVVYKSNLLSSVYLEGEGSTSFHIGFELFISALLLITAAIYHRQYIKDDKNIVYILLVAGFLIAALGEMAFTLNTVNDGAYATYNLLGYLYKLVARFLIFRGLFIINIKKPYMELSEAKKRLYNYVDDLERSVEQRTKEITRANEKIIKNLRDAKHIQMALMTTEFPKVPGMEFAAKYLPCEQIGGDFYNVFRLDEQHIGILIGDVAGHGVSAAMVNVFINQNMRFRIDYEDNKYRILTPRGVLMNLYHIYNNMSFPEEMYVVLFYGIYNTETGKLTYASAGMNTYPVIIKSNGKVSYIKLDGFPICKFGKYFKPDYETKTIDLAPGDSLVFYSDGLREIDRKRPDLFTTENIMEYLKGMEKYTAKEICQELFGAYHTLLGGNEMLDDVTILVVKTPPSKI
ncbi:MAG: MASE3 domain-containing protein [Caldicoprobacterales bacterium]|nr:SpoIIE family protein phosphatase [Clostridiales bacterium]